MDQNDAALGLPLWHSRCGLDGLSIGEPCLNLL
jgi:hypothetical protein